MPLFHVLLVGGEGAKEGELQGLMPDRRDAMAEEGELAAQHHAAGESIAIQDDSSVNVVRDSLLWHAVAGWQASFSKYSMSNSSTNPGEKTGSRPLAGLRAEV